MDDRDSLIAAVRSVAKRLGVRSLPIATFLGETGTGQRRIYRAFGSWPALCEAAGLVPHARNRQVPDGEIFAAMRDAFLRHGGVCTQRRFLAEAPFSQIVLSRRFPTWRAALDAFRLWAAESEPGFPYRDALERRPGAPAAAGDGRPGAAPGPAWPSRGGRACGDHLGFRAMLFAPVNEQGVVLLFGMVAGELGYGIETVAQGFPDCTAKRRTAPGRWESVRVEFEYRSRSFRDHGHDAEACDVIVCWEHDWPDCPLEVLALRAALAELPGR